MTLTQLALIVIATYPVLGPSNRAAQEPASLTFGKVAGSIAPAQDQDAQSRKPSPKWIKSIVEE